MKKILIFMMILCFCIACQSHTLSYDNIIKNISSYRVIQELCEVEYSLTFDLSNDISKKEDILFDNGSCQAEVFIEKTNKNEYILHISYGGYIVDNQFIIYSPIYPEGNGMSRADNTEFICSSSGDKIEMSEIKQKVEYENNGVEIAYQFKITEEQIEKITDRQSLTMTVTIKKLFKQIWTKA